MDGLVRNSLDVYLGCVQGPDICVRLPWIAFVETVLMFVWVVYRLSRYLREDTMDCLVRNSLDVCLGCVQAVQISA